MVKNFTEVFDEIKANVSTSASGKPVKSFSRSDFDKLAKAYLNTPDYKLEAVALKAGELVKKELEPVKALRGMIQRILLDFGVDKQEAARILDASYEIRNVDGIYELCSELVYQYANAGKKFDFITREDFAGSVLLKDVAAAVSKHKDIRTGEEFEVAKKAHKVLEKKSKVPKWLKDRVK
jgi:hypothetical protein